jgi:hypothetical protein
MREKFLAIPAALLLLAAPGVHAQNDVTHCVPIADAAARLACFDAATRGSQRTATDEAPSAGTTAPSPAAAAASASAGAPVAAAAKSADTAPKATDATTDDDSEFGLTKQENGPERITATVRSVASHTVPGRWVVTLDNDQVWEQRETTAANRRPRPGDSVTIEQSSFGSYLMITTGRGSSRVKRIR